MQGRESAMEGGGRKAASLSGKRGGARPTPMNSAPGHGWQPIRSINEHVMLGPRGILAAVLLLALDDARDGGPFAENAMRWIRDDRDGPCSFRRVCEALDLDPVKVRTAIRVKVDAPGGGGR